MSTTLYVKMFLLLCALVLHSAEQPDERGEFFEGSPLFKKIDEMDQNARAERLREEELFEEVTTFLAENLRKAASKEVTTFCKKGGFAGVTKTQSAALEEKLESMDVESIVMEGGLADVAQLQCAVCRSLLHMGVKIDEDGAEDHSVDQIVQGFIDLVVPTPSVQQPSSSPSPSERSIRSSARIDQKKRTFGNSVTTDDTSAQVEIQAPKKRAKRCAVLVILQQGKKTQHHIDERLISDIRQTYGSNILQSSLELKQNVRRDILAKKTSECLVTRAAWKYEADRLAGIWQKDSRRQKIIRRDAKSFKYWDALLAIFNKDKLDAQSAARAQVDGGIMPTFVDAVPHFSDKFQSLYSSVPEDLVKAVSAFLQDKWVKARSWEDSGKEKRRLRRKRKSGSLTTDASKTDMPKVKSVSSISRKRCASSAK